MGVTGKHMYSFYLITGNFKIQHLIGTDFPLLNKAVATYHNEELPFGIVPMLALRNSGLTDIHRELAAVCSL